MSTTTTTCRETEDCTCEWTIPDAGMIAIDIYLDQGTVRVTDDGRGKDEVVVARWDSGATPNRERCVEWLRSICEHSYDYDGDYRDMVDSYHRMVLLEPEGYYPTDDYHEYVAGRVRLARVARDRIVDRQQHR